MDECTNRHNFALLFNVPKYILHNIKSEMEMKTIRNPFAILMEEYGIRSYSDENSFYTV